MRSDCSDLSYELKCYRRNIHRYKINSWITNIKGTPIEIDKLLNSMKRKILGVPLLKPDYQKEYLDGIRNIYSEYYDKQKYPNISRRYLYAEYLTDIYILHKKEWNKHKMSYKEFKRSGLVVKYRDIMSNNK
jgi:hypothetical protein